MAKLLKSNRVIFPNKNGQEKFLLDISSIARMNWKEMASYLGLSERTVRDWAKGKYKMSLRSVIMLCKLSGIKYPSGLKIVSLKDHLRDIAKKGGLANFKKHKGASLQSPTRLKNWQKWWKAEGKERAKLKRKIIKHPSQNAKLAEFLGIMFGDGGVAPYHISVTLNSETDFEYSKFVCNLIFELFGIVPKVYKSKECLALNIIVHGINVVEFCQKIGLKKGNKLKKGLVIPDWIKSKENLQKAFLRGLFDTDGSVFIHRYKSNNKFYKYTKISFSSRSSDLIDSVCDMLKKYHFNARITKNHQEVRLESREDIIRFNFLIGSNNLKHKLLLRRVAPNGKAAVC